MNSSNLTVAVSAPQEIATPAQTGEFYDKINNPMEAIKTMGDWIAHSGMFGCVKPEQGYVLAMECLASRQTPLSWKRENHLINGNITMKSESMLSGLMQAGWDIEWVKFDAEAAIADFRKGQKELRVSFTAEDARVAGLIPAKPGSGWAKFPAEMLRARLISKATRMLDPRITQGRYTPEEVADFDRPTAPTAQRTEPVNVTPTAPSSDFTIVEKLEAALEGQTEKANAFLLSKNLIKEGQNFRDVSTKVANMILSDIPAFIAKIQ
jgi:hypothetical protein